MTDDTTEFEDGKGHKICLACHEGKHSHHEGHDCKNLIPSGQCCCVFHPWDGRFREEPIFPEGSLQDKYPDRFDSRGRIRDDY